MAGTPEPGHALSLRPLRAATVAIDDVAIYEDSDAGEARFPVRVSCAVEHEDDTAVAVEG